MCGSRVSTCGREGNVGRGYLSYVTDHNVQSAPMNSSLGNASCWTTNKPTFETMYVEVIIYSTVNKRAVLNASDHSVSC